MREPTSRRPLLEPPGQQALHPGDGDPRSSRIASRTIGAGRLLGV
jgi:hypothetical protein